MRVPVPANGATAEEEVRIGAARSLHRNSSPTGLSSTLAATGSALVNQVERDEQPHKDARNRERGTQAMPGFVLLVDNPQQPQAAAQYGMISEERLLNLLNQFKANMDH